MRHFRIEDVKSDCINRLQSSIDFCISIVLAKILCIENILVVPDILSKIVYDKNISIKLGTLESLRLNFLDLSMGIVFDSVNINRLVSFNKSFFVHLESKDMFSIYLKEYFRWVEKFAKTKQLTKLLYNLI